MKTRIILLAVILLSLVSNVKSQASYYFMKTNLIEGMNEYLSNSKLVTDYLGIAFVSGSRMRGMVNDSGRWTFLNPTGPFTTDYINRINTNMNVDPGLTIASDGCIAAKYLHLKDIAASSESRLKIELNSAGKPVIYAANGQLRLGGVGGVRIWGNNECYESDTPHFMVNSDKIEANVPFNVKRSGVNLLMNADANNNDFWVGTTTNHGLYLGTNNGANFYIDNNQRVYIGVSEDFRKTIRAELKNKYYMFISKGVLSEDFAIAPASSWADFVFNKDYRLRDIEEVENFIEENNHLPDVPSAADVAEDGYSQHDMNKVLLQKIEELTLYTIQQQKEIKALKSELNELKK